MSGLHFLTPTAWVGTCAVAAALLLAWVLYLESRGARRLWRRWALVLAVGCLFLLATRPARWVASVPGSAVLVTPRATPEQLTGMTSTAGVFTLASGLAGGSALTAEAVPDVALLTRRHPEVRHWQIVGAGLPAWDLAVLPGTVSLRASEPEVGVDRARWQRRIALGEEMVVTGTVVVPSTFEGRLRLHGPGTIEDEVEIGAARRVFTLRATPRHEGPFLYRLELLAGEGGALVEEIVDLVVGPRRPPRVLWLAGAPGFETRQVKSWLRDVGGELALRTQVSRGRFRYEYLNRPRVDLSQLTADLLAGFDLALVDAGAWRSLSRGDRELLRRAVAEGLGLVLVPPLPRLEGEDLFAGIGVQAIGDLGEHEVAARGPGLAALAPLVTPARELLPGGGVRSLLVDGGERVLATLRPYGLGSVIATVLEETHRWVLRGDGAAHRRYWSHLLAHAARVDRDQAGWSLPAGPLTVDRPLPVGVVASDHRPLTVYSPAGDEVLLPLEQSVIEPRRWAAVLWPREVGWHRLGRGAGGTWFYVQAGTAWSAWHQRQAQEATRRRVVLGGQDRVSADAGPGRAPRALSRMWLFVAAVLALALVWADEQWWERPAAMRAPR